MTGYDDDEDLIRRKRQGLIGALVDDQPVSRITDPPVTQAAPFQGSTDASSSRYAPRIAERGGNVYLQEHGNERLLQPGQEQTSGRQYATDFWAQHPTGFQPDVGGGKTATGAPVGAQTNAGYQQTGWGFDSPTGGRKEFSYTPQRYAGGMENFSGFSPQGAGSSDVSSIKNIWRDTAVGLGSGPEGFTEAKMDEAIARLNAQGIPATKVDPYQIDFGNGEGPIQVRSSGNQVWWNNRATEGGGMPSSSNTGAQQTTTTQTGGGSDALSQIQALIASLMTNGYDRNGLIQQLGL
jgi:hypothetical protein